jgi:SAM-dependent methyltransferase
MNGGAIVDMRSRLAEVRDGQRRHWTGVADAWDRWFDWTEQNFAPLTAWLRDRTDWRPGAHVLDVGCGAGYPALAAAAAVLPGGRVTAIDISAKMIGAASRRAADAGLDNLDLREMDADAMDFPDDTFDTVTCVCTLMFSPEPRRAIGEIRRVLKPGGRFGIVVWDEPSLNPFSMVLVGLLGTFMALPPLPGGDAPGPFRFAERQALESVLQSGGFSRFTIENVTMTFDFPSVEAYLQVVSEVAGWTRRLEALSPDAQFQLRQAVAEAAEPYCVGGRVRIGSAVHCAFGRK